MKQILIVEDDSFLNKMLAYNLTADGYGVTSALNARTAAEAIRQREFNLVLLDINLPDGNGFELCKLIKPQHPDTIVIFLTANDQESDQIRGYEVGAVDYITKPFVIGALQRKIKAMFAMLEHHKPAKDIYDDGRLFLDFSEQTASLNGKPLTLSPMEYKMLNLFRKNPRQVLTRGQLLEKLWDIDERFVDEHTLTTSISRIRSKIEAVERCYARHELKDDYFAVILDWKMPEMDGIETARQIRKRIGKEIPIIVLTSYEFSEIEEEAKAAGVDAFIAKPLFRSRLTATLRQFTSGRKEKIARNYLEKLSESDYTGKRILLVEDNELNREIAGEILQMTGAKVETAENGKIAVEKVEASPKGSYDLVFMDIQMPVMNGYEATAAIRSLPGEKGKLPIVAMTANAFAEDVQLAKNTGMNGHIAKPLDMNKLNDVLESWL